MAKGQGWFRDGSLVTKIEEEMFEKGYASSRMCAYKLRKNFKSVLRQVSRGQFTAVRIGQQQFINIASIQAWYSTADPESIKVMGLDDWADVFTVDEQERLHVRQEA